MADYELRLADGSTYTWQGDPLNAIGNVASYGGPGTITLLKCVDGTVVNAAHVVAISPLISTQTAS